MCSSVTRKTKNICDEDNVENLDNEQFESYREECILNGGTDDCDDISVNSLSDSEYEEYKKKCGKPTMNCENINPDNLSKKEVGTIFKNLFGKILRVCGKLQFFTPFI